MGTGYQPLALPRVLSIPVNIPHYFIVRGHSGRAVAHTV
jgi:hypothetical protein